MRLILLITLIGYVGLAHSQTVCGTQRYVDPIFPQVTEHIGVVYANADPFGPLSNDELEMDIYEPTGDSLGKRPLIVFQHGGIFLVGWENQPPIPDWARYFAKRGYVVASIEYRLGFNLLSTESAERAVYRAGQDNSAATRFLADHASQYGIDTSHIYLAGTSSGAIASLHTAYYEPSERPLSTFGNTLEPSDLGCGTCAGNNNFNNQFVPIKGVINYWGAIYDTSYLGAPKNIPVLSMYGTEDNTVTPYYGAPYDVDALFPSMAGSVLVHQRLQNLGIQSELVALQGAGHEPELNNLSVVPEYLDTMLMAADPFLYSLLQPEIDSLHGIAEACSSTIKTYSVTPNQGSDYCWNVTGGHILIDRGNEIDVIWTDLGTQTISVQEINNIKAVSDAITKQVQVITAQPTANLVAINENDSTVSFVNQSIGADNWILDFGDSTTPVNISPGDTITHSYWPGSYTATLLAISECRTTFDTIAFAITNPQDSVADTTIQTGALTLVDYSGWRIYPTLIHNGFTIARESNSSNEIQVVIYSLQGKIIEDRRIRSNTRIATASWEPGVYFVSLITESQVETTKVLLME